MVISSKRVRVPKYVQYVEYIESTGTQYIDTGFNPNSNTRVVMDAQHMSINNGAEFYAHNAGTGDFIAGGAV